MAIKPPSTPVAPGTKPDSEPLLVTVGVAVGTAVGVAVGVAAGVAAGVAVGVATGVAVGVATGVAVGNGAAVTAGADGPAGFVTFPPPPAGAACGTVTLTTGATVVAGAVVGGTVVTGTVVAGAVVGGTVAGTVVAGTIVGVGGVGQTRTPLQGLPTPEAKAGAMAVGAKTTAKKAAITKKPFCWFKIELSFGGLSALGLSALRPAVQGRAAQFTVAARETSPTG